MSESPRWTLDRKIGVGVLIALAALLWNPVTRYLDKLAEIPNAQYVSMRIEDGRTLVTIKNTSTTDTLALTDMTYEIGDPELLKQIAVVHPRPNPNDRNQYGTQNPVNDVRFSYGYWNDDSYCFDAAVGFHIPPGAVEDVHPSFDGGQWKGLQLNGTLTIRDDNKKVLTVKDVSVLTPNEKVGGN